MKWVCHCSIASGSLLNPLNVTSNSNWMLNVTEHCALTFEAAARPINNIGLYGT